LKPEEEEKEHEQETEGAFRSTAFNIIITDATKKMYSCEGL
jgi:hypothetical protein